MGYINPLLELPASIEILSMPSEVRQPLERLFREIRLHANEQAEICWNRRKSPMATYWRAVSTYSRHIAVMLSSPGEHR